MTRSFICYLSKIARISLLFVITTGLLLLCQACGSTPVEKPAGVQPTRISETLGPPGSIAPSPTPTLLPSALHGPTNFLLSTPFNFSQTGGTSVDSSGAKTQLDATTVQDAISNELKHFLFVVDSSNAVKVYTQGATKPIATEVTQSTEGATVIQYTQVVDAVTTTFACRLSNDSIEVIYHQQYSGNATTDDPLAKTGSDVAVQFTTHVQWVASSDIPLAPGNGTYQTTGNGGVMLSWSAAQNARQYHVYRMIQTVDTQFQFLDTVSTPQYKDDSPEFKDHSHTTTGILYAIFSVGPTGVENPSDMVITVSSH